MGMIFARTPPTLPLEGGGCSRGGVTRGGPPGMLNSMSDIVAVLPATLLAPGESRRERPRSAMACSRAAAELPRVDVGEVGRSPIPTPKAEPAARARAISRATPKGAPKAAQAVAASLATVA